MGLVVVIVYGLETNIGLSFYFPALCVRVGGLGLGLGWCGVGVGLVGWLGWVWVFEGGFGGRRAYILGPWQPGKWKGNQIPFFFKGGGGGVKE